MDAKDLFVNATTKNFGSRAFVPYNREHETDFEDVEQGVIKHKCIGLVKMEGSETPESLNISFVKDPQEKLLAYFLIGGHIENLNDELYGKLTDNDWVVVMGTNKAGELKAAFLIDQYDPIQTITEFKEFKRSFSFMSIMETIVNSKKTIQ